MAQLWEGKNWGWIWQRGGIHRPEPSIAAAPDEMPALASAGKRAAETPLRRQAAKLRPVKCQAVKCQAARCHGKWALCNTCAPTKAVNNRWRRNPGGCPPFYSERGPGWGSVHARFPRALPRVARLGSAGDQPQFKATTPPRCRDHTSMSFKNPACSYGSCIWHMSFI